MPIDRRTHEIVAAFQRYARTRNAGEIEALSLAELRSADEQLGQRDMRAAYRIGMQNRIRELEEQGRRQHENEQEQNRRQHESRVEQDRRRHGSRVRALQLIMALIIGIIIGLVVAELT